MRVWSFNWVLLKILIVLLMMTLPLLISGEVTLSDVYGSLEQYQYSKGR